MNENAGLLHYQHQEDKPAQVHSLLIDAGGDYSGYASDITRSYSYESGETLFNDLLQAMQQHQDKLIDGIRIGRRLSKTTRADAPSTHRIIGRKK